MKSKLKLVVMLIIFHCITSDGWSQCGFNASWSDDVNYELVVIEGYVQENIINVDYDAEEIRIKIIDESCSNSPVDSFYPNEEEDERLEYIRLETDGNSETFLVFKLYKNNTDEEKYIDIVLFDDSFNDLNILSVTQGVEPDSRNYYLDSDGDGYGDSDADPQRYNYINEVIPSNLVTNNSDKCNDIYFPENNGCPTGKELREVTKNWIISKTYDITGELTSKSKSYSNSLGKPTQSQTYDTKEDRVWATQTMYDELGRSSLQTLKAPISKKNEAENYFQYAADFIKKSDNSSNFSESDFEDDIYNPATIGNKENTLGWYYSSSNNDESYQDITDRPYSRTIYSSLNPGTTLKTIGGNKIDTNGDFIRDEWKEGFSYTFSAAQEPYYALGSNEFNVDVSDDYLDSYKENSATLDTERNNIAWLKATKTVSQDVHGIEHVVFTDGDGKTLASAKSGVSKSNGGVEPYSVMSLIGEQGFVDVHIPIGCDGTLSFVGDTNSGNYKVWNLRTEIEITNKDNLPAGFYRIEYTGNTSRYTDYPNLTKINSNGTISAVFNGANESVGVSYKVNYHDYAVNKYDKAGRLIESIQPVAFDNKKALSSGIKTTYSNLSGVRGTSIFEYNGLGQLIKSTSPDEGTVEFIYREDGQIRFSQNEKQKNNVDGEEFSYTNYDALARPTESGVARGNFSVLDADISNFTGLKQWDELLETVYDTSINVQNKFPWSDLTNNHGKQTFVRGNVSCTKNKNVETYYSYDVYGRVKWIVRYIVALDECYTIDYIYDAVTSEVTTVDYQKNVPNGRYVHRYIYNFQGQLTDVLTSTGASIWNHQVSYQYYETGSLKRKELAKTIDWNQGGYNETDNTVMYTKDVNNKEIVLQGIDYVYNLTGQLKQINGIPSDKIYDPGGDGENDAFGMMIGYYPGDYRRHVNNSGNHSENLGGTPQYNGNISSIEWVTKDGNMYSDSYYYEYDAQTNWLKGASFKTPIQETEPSDILPEITLKNDQTSSLTTQASKVITLEDGFSFKASAGKTFTASIVEIAQAVSATGDYNVHGITYDVNGNIQTLARNAGDEAGSNAMDNLEYTYDDKLPNRLIEVRDALGTRYGSDFGATTTYGYNEIGQLETETKNSIVTAYEYTAAGLVSSVSGGGQTISFTYDDLGQRLAKEYDNGTKTTITYYIRDVSGNVMSIYTKDEGTYVTQTETPIYGEGRVGVAYKNGTEQYEITDHLGNVRSVVERNSTQKSFSDYYPFGMQMPGRKIVNGEAYRYAYQGQEYDPENPLQKEAFELRLWDSRIGRWLTTDPKGQYSSPYLGMGNNPLIMFDPDGGMAYGPFPISGDVVVQGFYNLLGDIKKMFTKEAVKTKLRETRSATREVAKQAGNAEAGIAAATVLSSGSIGPVTVPMMAELETIGASADVTSLFISIILLEKNAAIKDLSDVITPGVIDNSLTRPLKHTLIDNVIPQVDTGMKLLNREIKNIYDTELTKELK